MYVCMYVHCVIPQKFGGGERKRLEFDRGHRVVCVVTNLYNVLYFVNTQLYISTVIYINLGHIMAVM